MPNFYRSKCLSVMTVAGLLMSGGLISGSRTDDTNFLTDRRLQSGEDNGSGGSNASGDWNVTPYDFGKTPEKGSPNCSSWANWNSSGSGNRPPCRYSDSDILNNGNSQGNVSFTFIPDELFQQGTNRVPFAFFVALGPGQPSLNRLVTRAVSEYLNETHEQLILYIRKEDRELQEQRDGFEGHNQSWSLFHLYTDSDLLTKYSTKWWWHYTLFFDCYWTDTQEPLTNLTIRKAISWKLTTDLQSDIDSGAFRGWIANHFADFLVDEFTTFPDRVNGEGNASQPSGSPVQGDDPFDNDTLIRGPLDPYSWDWRRYLGLGVFLATFIVTCTLMQLAAYRQRRLRAHELWGNLGTNEGVDEMLKTGWKVRGSHLELYDKTKLGYVDDDSMLIGGFERQPVLGAEITVTQTQPGSDTTQQV